MGRKLSVAILIPVGNPQGAVVVADSVTIGGSLRLLLEVFLCFFCLLAGTMPHAPAMRRFPVSDATRLVESDLESGEIPDSDLESDNASDLSSLTVAALGNARSWSLACRMDTEETPQVVVAITHDPCDEALLLAAGGHMAETPQFVIAIAAHLGGEDCQPVATRTNVSPTFFRFCWW